MTLRVRIGQRPLTHRLSPHILYQFTTALIGQQLILMQIDQQAFETLAILHRTVHARRECGRRGCPTVWTTLGLSLMFSHFQTNWWEVNDLPMLQPFCLYVGDIPATLGTVRETMSNDVIRSICWWQGGAGMPQLPSWRAATTRPPGMRLTRPP